jgi:F-type H+-transporting ATPase subunit b
MSPVIANSLVNVDPGLFIWTAVIFFSFLLILAKFVWKPLLGSLQQREQSIRESLDAAETAMKKAEQVSKANEDALRQAEAVAHSIRKDAMDEAEKIRAERIEKAKAEAAALVDAAKTAIDQEKKRAIEELRNEVADLAILSAKKILSAELDEKKNRALVDGFIKDLSGN